MQNLDNDVERFQELVGQLAFRLFRRDPELLISTEITEAQFVTGLLLRTQGRKTMTELAEAIGTGLSTLSGIIDRMVRKEYVERERDESDRRLVRVKLTPMGEKLIDDIHAKKHEHLKPIMINLDKEDRKIVLSLLTKIVDGLKDK